MRHALVVGGTGMLWGVCERLAAEGWAVSVVSRGVIAIGPDVHPVRVDYRDGDALRMNLRAAVAARGPVGLAVCWVHGDGPMALAIVAREVACAAAPVRLVHIVGSAVAGTDRGVIAASMAGIKYQRIVLGFIADAAGPRWLTHDEIAAGVLKGIREDAPEWVVGRSGPREDAPRDGWA